MLFELVIEKAGAAIRRRHGWMAERRFLERAGLVYVVVMLSAVPVATLVGLIITLMGWWPQRPDGWP
jgi:hypothetical protein